MLKFNRGTAYTRADVKETAGVATDARGGKWDTGVVEHMGEFLIFANVGTEGRTGHDYGNRWERGRLRWYHRNGSHLGWPSVQRIVERGRRIHVFWRESNDAAFEYAGIAAAIEIADTSPVEIVWSVAVSRKQMQPPIQSPEQVVGREYLEGAVHKVLVNAYERDPQARQACIRHYGPACVVCDLDFRERYGPIGAGFIHVHHVIPLSELGRDYKVNPVEDLRPVCPNCHAMLHRRRPPIPSEDLRAALHA